MTRDTVLGTREWKQFRPIGTVLNIVPQPTLFSDKVAQFEFQLTGRTLIIDVIKDTYINESLGDKQYLVMYPDESTFSFVGRIKEERT